MSQQLPRNLATLPFLPCVSGSMISGVLDILRLAAETELQRVRVGARNVRGVRMYEDVAGLGLGAGTGGNVLESNRAVIVRRGAQERLVDLVRARGRQERSM